MANKKQNCVSRQDLYKLVANEAGYKYEEVKYVLDLTFTIIGRLLASNKNVRIPSFGLFEVFKTSKHIMYNFKNEPVEVESKKVPKFRPSDSLKKVVQNSDTNYVVSYGFDEEF